MPTHYARGAFNRSATINEINWSLGLWESQAPNTYQAIILQTVHSREPGGLVISARCLEPAALGLTNQSLQWTWFLLFTTKTFPNAPQQTNKQTNTTVNLPPTPVPLWGAQLLGIQPVEREVLRTGYLQSRIRQGSCEDWAPVNPSNPQAFGRGLTWKWQHILWIFVKQSTFSSFSVRTLPIISSRLKQVYSHRKPDLGLSHTHLRAHFETAESTITLVVLRVSFSVYTCVPSAWHTS